MKSSRFPTAAAAAAEEEEDRGGDPSPRRARAGPEDATRRTGPSTGVGSTRLNIAPGTRRVPGSRLLSTGSLSKFWLSKRSDGKLIGLQIPSLDDRFLKDNLQPKAQ
jgi:hypothetical protein